MEDGHGERGVRRLARRTDRHGARRAGQTACLTALAAILLGSVVPQVAAARGRGFSWTPSKTEPYAVCGRMTPGHAACLAIAVPPASAISSAALLKPVSPVAASPAYTGSGIGGGYDPAALSPPSKPPPA